MTTDHQAPPTPPPPSSTDSDHDGLSDAAEAAGLLTASGARIFTNPNAGDTDGDGLWDGDEAGSWTGAHWAMPSDPTLADTDWDYADDLAEAAYGTDPRARDTDADGDGDWSEAAFGMDPLLYTERFDPLVAAVLRNSPQEIDNRHRCGGFLRLIFSPQNPKPLKKGNLPARTRS